MFQIILSALFHDIGHLIGLRDNKEQMITGDVIIGTKRHENIGAEYLQKYGFPSCVSDPILHHVEVKRYKVYRNPEYYNSELTILKLII